MEENISISVENVSKKFPLRYPQKSENGNEIYEHTALENISFKVKKGESVGVIGTNGSGKSTLLQILAGITKPTSGNVLIQGKVASILDIGTGFHPELSGRENIYLNGQIHGFSRKEIEKVIDEIIHFSEIGNFIEEPVKSYSNGMYLRLAFSIIVHLDFDVYLFDEVMNVGDIGFREKSNRKLKELTAGNKTFIFVSHQLNELEDKDFFLHLEKGVLKQQSHQVDILRRYIESTLLSEEFFKIYTSNFEVKKFKTETKYKDLELVSVSLTQNSESFVTNKEFEVTIVYDKLLDTGTLDVMLLVQDISGNIVLVSSPVANGSISHSKDKNRYILKCTIPENFLISKVYKIAIQFIRNLETLLKSDDKDLIDKNINSLYENIIAFKPIYLNNNETIDLLKINIKYSMLLALKWEILQATEQNEIS